VNASVRSVPAAAALASRCGFIEELCVALRHEWRPNELFVIFTAYFDEADTHGPAPTVIMAAYVGHAYQWVRFEKKLSRIKSKYDFTIFHAKDFKGRTGEFKGWSIEKCDFLIADLMDLVRYNLTEGIVTSLSRDRYVNEYLAPPIPKKFRHDSQYGACFRVCLGRLIGLMENRNNRDRINIVIEDGHVNVHDCLRIFKDISDRWKLLGADVLGTFTVAKKHECAPLMVADMLAGAHSIYRTAVKQGTIDPREFTIPIQPNKPMFIKGAIAMIEPAPDALKNLKKVFEAERQQGIDAWRAQRDARKGTKR
jgi:hypothetical protein